MSLMISATKIRNPKNDVSVLMLVSDRQSSPPDSAMVETRSDNMEA
jgi:hypothetical protein